MTKEYYAPKIEEFHVGFEYEVKDPILKEWVEFIVESNFKTNPFWFPSVNAIRVKRLDREDIDSLNIPDWASIEKLASPYKYRIEAIENNTGKNEIVYQGIIKNKSELRKILIQTEIIK